MGAADTITKAYMRENTVCEAIEKMMSDNKNLGKAEGKLSAFAELVKDGLLSIKDAAARMNMTEAEFEDAMQRMKQ